MIITDGSVVIDWPSNYAGQGYSIEDGHRQYKSGVLDSNGDARFDLKTGKSFRTYAPNSVFVNIQGFTGWKGYARNTTLKKEESGFRLMFKEQYNLQEDFLVMPQVDIGDMDSQEDLVFTLQQTSSVKREVYDAYLPNREDNSIVNLYSLASTAPTLSGTSYPVLALYTMMGETYQADFLITDSGTQKVYPGIVLR